MNNQKDIKSWKEMIDKELKLNEESWDDVESCTLTEEELNIKFDTGYGGIRGKPFTLWTKNSVYFPLCYDGAEFVGRVSRNPDGKPTGHHGGG